MSKEVRPEKVKEDASRAQQLIFSASGGMVDLTLEEAAPPRAIVNDEVVAKLVAMGFTARSLYLFKLCSCLSI